MPARPRRRYGALPVLLTLWFGLLIRLWGLARLPLLPDEAYYWLWSQRPALAYYDHPAGTAQLLRLSTALGGQGEFGVRWLNALLGAACVALVWAIGRASPRVPSPRVGRPAAPSSLPVPPGGGKGGFPPLWGESAAAPLVVAFGAPFVVISRFVYTDTLFIFLMLLNFWCFLRLVREARSWAPYVAWGVSLALLFNTKYTALLYAGALGLWLLVLWHPLLRERRFLIAALIGAAGLAPVIGWNAAHDWASFRWQITHLVSPSPGGATQVSLLWTWLGNARHAVGYLTWPVALAGLTGGLLLLWGRALRPGHIRLLEAVALAQLVPVLLSPAGSPRNLSGGLVFLLLSLGTARLQGHSVRLLVSGVVALVALYGVGTVAALDGSALPFQSSVVGEIHRDVAGVEELAAALAASPAPVFTIDYGLAGQLSYTMGRPAYTSWGQYRIWGYPTLAEVTVVSSPYLPLDLVESHLRQAFETVDGPYQVPDQPSQACPGALQSRGCGNLAKVSWWRAAGLRRPQERFVAAFDFLTLAEQVP